uniref:Uncharacterized protein n=1 Tax=Panagrolaimus sp. ES5 TaxID=591445 RepID=A0AC34G2Z6_9BILA
MDDTDFQSNSFFLTSPRLPAPHSYPYPRTTQDIKSYEFVGILLGIYPVVLSIAIRGLNLVFMCVQYISFAMESQLAKLNIADKELIQPACQFVSSAKGVAGAYILNVKPGAKVYRYDIEIIKVHPDATKNKTLTKRASDDGEISLRKILCMEVLTTFKKSSDNFGIGIKGEHYVYDGGKSFYLAAPMVLDAGKKRKEFAIEEFSTFCKNQLVDCSV